MNLDSRRTALALANLAATSAAIVVVAASSLTEIRAPATAIIVLGVGISVMPRLGSRDLAMNVLLVLFVSVVVLICIAQLVTYVSVFSWQAVEWCLFGLTVIASTVELASERRRQRQGERRRGR